MASGKSQALFLTSILWKYWEPFSRKCVSFCLLVPLWHSLYQNDKRILSCPFLFGKIIHFEETFDMDLWVLPSISLLSFWKHFTLRFLFVTWMCQLRGSLFNITMNHSTNFCEKKVKSSVTLCCLLMTPYFNMKKIKVLSCVYFL